ncbi:GNAT family N-acetyltransferase [Chryseobacterium indoltheticum]|uniref:GNAT family N-acetyltransferase n=1 Tax=Chryseobacterium indoltheticum TaxID=254 RepID=UPI0028E8BF22|nr:GNAT family N-acetyltransferase [Chryseobacterium indoltheticum]
MIVLKSFNKIALFNFINSKEFNDLSFLPISYHRAISHINNPHVNNEDTILILAYYENKLAGYIGILADDMRVSNKFIKIGWLSTLFVHPDYRGKKIAQMLLKEACNSYKGNIIITEYTEEAKNMYERSNLFVIQKPLYGSSYHFLFNLSEILPKKNKNWNYVYPVLRLMDKIINGFLYSIRRNKSSEKHFLITEDLDCEIKEYIKRHDKLKIFNRNVEDINWITNYPWILNTNENKESNYQFSDFDKSFRYIFIKIYDANNLDIVLMLTVRNGKATLQFIYGNKNNNKITEALIIFLSKFKITNIIIYDKEINQKLEKKYFIYVKERNRSFMMHKDLSAILPYNFIFDVLAGDGDPIFT